MAADDEGTQHRHADGWNELDDDVARLGDGEADGALDGRPPPSLGGEVEVVDHGLAVEEDGEDAPAGLVDIPVP